MVIPVFTVEVATAVQPFTSVPVTLYIVLTEGLTLIVLVVALVLQV
jgi:F0F1-type ATP synthase membrane subunit c/vacuolar-type H+-ATPase subunit K